MARDLVAEAPPEAGDAKRFGTFLGVFTPSLLTILGVIMYQRFGWVVGNAGLGGALLVVLFAHVISVTTGLSVASIATNRTVRTGGNYYIISRSLGLSIGGAIGMALYVALALGVSLYLIGFAEAFVAATGLEITGNYKDDLRIIGSLACLGISGLTLYSTEIALKSQLFVLTAIALSLVSLLGGAALPAEAGHAAVEMWPPPGAADPTVVFAVFFPAVTGFTAGVGMSGDLKDPKRAIPLGTMAAILVGLAIYLALPALIAERAPVGELIADKNIMLRISWEPRLVTLGVFAATLSSALGSILGAPRTLQALAFDGIVPRFLGRGRDEPRVALLVTILIAEGGILIGELDIVGAILSMFFLTSYGFLCLACGLERWASPDFRPQFKVPVWVSLLGAVACFMVMFQINALAMFGSILIMGLVYAVLKRRQLVLSTGDTWGGVWSAVVRVGLLRLSRSSSRELTRNWRPNMVVASREQGRSALLDFARAVVGDRGILTHFQLVKGGPAKPRPDRDLESKYPGLFARVQGVEDPFVAIPTVASNFGLAGMETNVVLIGWPRDASTNARYAQMIDRLLELDISVLMLRVDRTRGFGRGERVDVWWDGVSPTGQLMLTLVHLLSTSNDWKNARIRVLVNGRPDQDEVIAKRRLDEVIADARIAADGVLLPPLADADSLPDRVRQESAFADLVVVHALEATDDQGFVAVNDALVAPLRTALLVRPASRFDDAPAIFDLETAPAEAAAPTVDLGLEDLSPALAGPMVDLGKRLDDAATRFAQSVQHPSLEEEEAFLAAVQAELEQIRRLPSRVARRGGRKEVARGLVDWAQARFGEEVVAQADGLLAHGRRAEAGADGEPDSAWQTRLRQGVTRLEQDLAEAAAALPAETIVEIDASGLMPNEADTATIRVRKGAARLAPGTGTTIKVPVRQLGTSYIRAMLRQRLAVAVGHIGARRYDALARARRLVSDVDKCFSNLRAELDQAKDERVDVALLREMVRREVEGLERVAAGVTQRFHDGNESSVFAVRELVRSVRQSLLLSLRNPWKLEGPKGPKDARSVEGLPGQWQTRQAALHRALSLDVQCAGLQGESRRSVFQLVARLRKEIHEGPVAALLTAERVMREVATLLETEDEERGSTDLEGQVDSTPPHHAHQEAYLKAADELRGTWEREYRPDPRELIDPLVSSLARAAERLPNTAVTLDEATGTEVDGLPQIASYPVRRLAQAFLETRIVQPAREAVAPWPEQVRHAEEVLVDAVRLAAFELEHAGGGDNEEDVEADASHSLAGVLEDRVRRLEGARQVLEDYVDEVQVRLLEEAGRALSDARLAVTTTTITRRSGPSPRVEAAGAEVAQGVRRVVARARKRLSPAVASLARRGEAEYGPSGLVDELLALRDQIDADPEVQASLPMVYRRVFGRAALETAGVLVGRGRQLEQLSRMVGRWRDGAGGPIAVLGERRSGRTTLVNIVGRELMSGATVVRVSPPPGGTADPDALNAAVNEAVGGREGQSAEGALRAMPPGALIVLDGLGRWMERAPSGLAALTAWRRLWRRLGARHLFVVTATDYAWDYADAMMDLAGGFVGSVRTDPLSPEELLRGLRLRQRTSELDLGFEGVSGRSARTERRQLARAHERSQGNVGVALDIWRRSVVEVGSRRVVVSVKPPPDASVLSKLPVAWYAGLVAVVFHRGLTPARMARVMRLGREEATGLLQDLERAGLVSQNAQGVYSADAIMRPLVLAALRNKGALG